MSSIQLTIPEELKGILNTFDYLYSNKLIKIQFTESYRNKIIYQIFNVDTLAKSLKELERRIKDAVPTLTNSQYMSIENIIYQDLDKIAQQNKSNYISNIKIEKVQALRKFEHHGKVYESIIVNNQPYFITASDNDGENDYNLVEHIELANNTFLPQDGITTKNPLPYVFESDEELNQYITKAKSETFDSLFTKVLTEFKRYVNAPEHVLTILSADIIYSYFQDRFGTTHYNIFIGDNGSGKNSALLVFRYLGYRPFYVTGANATNYYTFLGDIQEGQGTIAEDEADDIDRDKDKQRILKTGYANGGSVPKIEFSSNGSRSQKPYLTFCHKWLAMEEIPDERKIKGVLDRSFIFKFLAGEIQYNIKDVQKDENSELYGKLMDLRKTIFIFKILHQKDKFEDIQLNIKNRNAELTKPLLRLFNHTQSLDKIRNSLSILINEKSKMKSNSIEAKILEALNNLISSNNEENKEVYQFTNEQIFDEVRRVMDGLENQWDNTYSTFITPDGLHVSKKKIKQILISKFNAVPDKVSIDNETKRVVRVNKNWLEKLGKQYEVIEDIRFLDTELTDNQNGFCNPDTMTDQTLLEGASPDYDEEIGKEHQSMEHNNDSHVADDDEGLLDNCTLYNDNANSTTLGLPDNNKDVQMNTPLEKDHGSNKKDEVYDNASNSSSTNSNIDNIPIKNQPVKKLQNYGDTASGSVRSVRSAMQAPKIYPCMFCSDYSTHIDFDMELHLLEKHKQQLLRLPIKGNLDKREDWVIAETKKRMIRGASTVSLKYDE
jgi:hypothetical protein